MRHALKNLSSDFIVNQLQGSGSFERTYIYLENVDSLPVMTRIQFYPCEHRCPEVLDR